MTSSISGNMSSMGFMRMQRPDPSAMAGKLFSKLDTQNKGYIEKSDLQSAFDSISSSGGSASVDDVFSQWDSDGDGKVTKDEMSTSLSKLAEELESQFNNMRMNGFGGQGGMPGMGAMGGMPPPPRGGDDAGFTKEELSSQLEEIGSSDSKHSELISSIVNNFDEADSDGDGKVSFKEAMAYDKANSSDGAASGTTASDRSEAAVMQKIMQLMQAYGGLGDSSSQSGLASLLSVSA